MTENQPTTFGPESNPADFKVEDVNAYLATADADERARVIALEDGEGGKKRATVTREFSADEPPGEQNPAQDGAEPPAGGEGAPEGESGPQNGAHDVGTKGKTFAEAVGDIVPGTDPTPGPAFTNTDRLAADGKSKGYTFAEQAEHAQALYGTGR